MRVPAWLIVDGADASAEAVLGLAARVEAQPADTASRDAHAKARRGDRGDVGGIRAVVAVRRDAAVGAVPQHVARLGLADARSAGRGIGRARRSRARRAGDHGRRGVHADAADRRRSGQRLVPEPDRPRADRVRGGLAGAVAARRRRCHRLRAASRRWPACRPHGSSARTAPASPCTTRRPASPSTVSSRTARSTATAAPRARSTGC